MADSREDSWEPSFTTGRSAEKSLERRLLRMLQRHARVLMVGAAVVIAGSMLVKSAGQDLEHQSRSKSSEVITPDPAFSSPAGEIGTAMAPSPGMSGSTYIPQASTEPQAPLERESARNVSKEDQIYAMALTDLSGLPPDTAPGSVIDLYVLWQPPLTRRPRVDLLIEDVVVRAISPPFTPESPYIADLLIAENEIADLIYGERFGRLSASLEG